MYNFKPVNKADQQSRNIWFIIISFLSEARLQIINFFKPNQGDQLTDPKTMANLAQSPTRVRDVSPFKSVYYLFSSTISSNSYSR